MFSPPNPSCTKFPHFLCTVCKIVVCSQHSFQFKEFNSQSASLTNSSRSPFKFPQPKHGCFMVFHKLFHGLALFIFFISFRFSQMCLLVVVNYPIWLILKSFNITYCIITQRVSLIWIYIYECTTNFCWSNLIIVNDTIEIRMNHTIFYS